VNVSSVNVVLVTFKFDFGLINSVPCAPWMPVLQAHVWSVSRSASPAASTKLCFRRHLSLRAPVCLGAAPATPPALSNIERRTTTQRVTDYAVFWPPYPFLMVAPVARLFLQLKWNPVGNGRKAALWPLFY